MAEKNVVRQHGVRSAALQDAGKLEIYRRTARARSQTITERWAGRRQEAWEVARRVASFIKERHTGARVIVFGSLLFPDSFGPHSDIDLAVEGVPWPAYLRLWSELEKTEPGFEIDLVDLALASPRLRAHVEREGVPL